MDSLIYKRDEALPKDFCDFVINKFEESNDTIQGMSGSGVNKDIKDSKDLMLVDQLGDTDWKYIYDYLREDLLTSMVEYMRLHPFLIRKLEDEPTFSNELSLVRTCQGRFSASRLGSPHMQMQRYVDREGYHAWHYENEVTEETMKMRQMAFMWYLNDVFGGGETEFRFQKTKVEARSGRAVIFPAFWTHTHRGNNPNSQQTKYIITGWIERVEPENVSLEFAGDYFV